MYTFKSGNNLRAHGTLILDLKKSQFLETRITIGVSPIRSFFAKPLLADLMVCVCAYLRMYADACVSSEKLEMQIGDSTKRDLIHRCSRKRNRLSANDTRRWFDEKNLFYVPPSSSQKGYFGLSILKVSGNNPSITNQKSPEIANLILFVVFVLHVTCMSILFMRVN